MINLLREMDCYFTIAYYIVIKNESHNHHNLVVTYLMSSKPVYFCLWWSIMNKGNRLVFWWSFIWLINWITGGFNPINAHIVCLIALTAYTTPEGSEKLSIKSG